MSPAIVKKIFLAGPTTSARADWKKLNTEDERPVAALPRVDHWMAQRGGRTKQEYVEELVTHARAGSAASDSLMLSKDEVVILEGEPEDNVRSLTVEMQRGGRIIIRNLTLQKLRIRGAPGSYLKTPEFLA